MVILYTIGMTQTLDLISIISLKQYNILLHLQLVGHDVGQISKSFMKNFGGHLIRYRRLTHFYKLKTTQSPLHLYGLISDERMPHPYDPHIERTVQFSNTYFQNCIVNRIG